MSRPQPSGSDFTAARAFARVGFPKLLAKLHLYATGTLRLAAIDAESAGVVEAADLVSTLVEKGLSGTLVWTLAEHATEAEIVGHACMKLYGMRSTLRRQLARTLGDDAIDERADEAPDAFARLSGQRAIAELARAFAHDAEASAYIGEMLLGRERAEIAEALDWTVQRVKVVRNRIRRTLEGRSDGMNDDREAGSPGAGSPSSPGPRSGEPEPGP